MKGQHKIRVEVVIDGENVISQVKEFSSGNPIYHSEEFLRRVDDVADKVRKGIEGIYGKRKVEDTLTTLRVKQESGISDAIDKVLAEERTYKVAEEFRFVMRVNGFSFFSVPYSRKVFEQMWEDLKDHKDLERVQYSVDKGNGQYAWSTL